MRLKKLAAMALTGIMALSSLTACGSSKTKSSDTASDKKVLRVGMECAYAPFNWTQDTDSTPDGSKAVKIYDSDYYAYGYDVAVAQKLADQMGMELEIHKVEWSSIGISLDAGDYDAIIAGMGKTAEREASYSFTEPYYYRDNCIVVKKGGEYENVILLELDARLLHSLELDGFRFLIRLKVQTSLETLRRHLNALWQSPMAAQMFVSWIFQLHSPQH